MPQLFHPSANSFARLSILGGLISLVLLVWGLSLLDVWSSFATGVGKPVEQPVPFSHAHHVGGLGIDCRYCHTSVETSRFAGLPATETCMSCHSQIWTNAGLLAPIRASYLSDVPIKWIRVHDLPDFVYFDHSIHVAKGVGCNTCHGPVDRMPLTWKVNTLYMKWCLDCHRNPEKFIRPKDQVFNVDYKPPADQSALGRRLVKEYGIQVGRLTDCSICHR